MTVQGKLLVASPSLVDPNFYRTVVFVCEDNDEGSLGLVLNRPTDVAVGEYLPDWVSRLVDPEVVFVGGPVQPETAVGLGRHGPPEAIDGWSPVGEDTGLVDLSAPPGDVAGVEDLRVFSGYAGWSAGQLDMEIAVGDWFVVEAAPDDPFSNAPDGLWRRVLRRQRNELAFFADYPPDPRLN